MWKESKVITIFPREGLIHVPTEHKIILVAKPIDIWSDSSSLLGLISSKTWLSENRKYTDYQAYKTGSFRRRSRRDPLEHPSSRYRYWAFGRNLVVLHQRICNGVRIFPRRDGESRATSGNNYVHYKKLDDQKSHFERYMKVKMEDAKHKAWNWRSKDTADSQLYTHSHKLLIWWLIFNPCEMIA